MKLERFKEKDSRKTFIIIFTVCCILLLAGVFLYTSFAVFSEEKQFNVINGTYQDPGDIYFAVYIDGEITNTFPSKDSWYYFESGSCTNGVAIEWNNYAWKANLDYGQYEASQGMATRVKCTLNFKKSHFSESVTTCGQRGDNAASCIKDNAGDNPVELVYDGTTDNNLRYVRNNPNNYVSFNGELWRIIGVMNNIDDGNGTKESRLKLVRSNSIGQYSWDTSTSNNWHGINEWSQADVMKLLNPGYESESIGGSLYYNRRSGNCYNDLNNKYGACDFSSSGLTDDTKNYITTAVWHTGSNDEENSYDNIKASKFYELERSDNTGKICSSGIYCNDTVSRTTTWTGYVGLIYPSDFGYATSGGANMNHDVCLNIYLNDYKEWEECFNNNWLDGSSKWTMTPHAYADGSYTVFNTYTHGEVGFNAAFSTIGIHPVVYLKSSVKITGGDGSEESPFTLSL